MSPDGNRCWVCQSGETTVWKQRGIDRPLEPEDFRITDARYGTTLTLLRCGRCGFVFADAREMPELVSLYERLDDPDYEAGAANRTLQMRWLLDLLKRHKPEGGTLLEIGAGSGLLVGEAKRRGLDAYGVEPSRSLVEQARRAGVELIQGTFPHPGLAGRRFDQILLVDVIEHVDDPHALLEACRKALAPGGLLMVVTPDLDSVPARLLGRRWWHLRLAHVGYFGGRTLAMLAQRAGLRVLARRRARWFFPIRYLAERVAVYLPVGGLVRAAGRAPGLKSLFDVIIPFNPMDSWVLLLEAHRDA